MTSGAEKTDLGDSEQDEENVYEVERIIDVRTEEGEVLYRVRWKNYASDDDTWEPEAHLDDCREVLLAYKRALAEAEAKKCILPMKSDVFDADSSESDKERPTETPTKKKKKKKRPEDEEVEEESASKEKRKKKKEKRKEDIRPRPAPESDEEDERAPSPPAPSAHKDKPTDAKKRLVDSEDEDEVPVPSKKHRKSKTKEGGKHRKERSEEGRQRKGGKKERRHQAETSEEEGTAPLEEDLSDEPSESQTDDPTGKSSERGRADDMPKKKTGKSELKLQGIKDFLHDKRSKKPDTPSPTLSQRENKLKILSSSRSRDEAVPLSSDSSDSSSRHKKAKSKGAESATVPPKVPSSASSTSSSSSIAAASTSKAREEEPRENAPKEKEQSASTNLFEKFLLNCEAKDRVPRRQAVHQPSPAEAGKAPKLIGKIEKRAKSAKESPARRSEEKTEKPRHTEDDKMEVEADTLGDRRGEVPAQRLKVGEDSRERRERQEEGPRGGERWERRNPSFEAADKRKKREDSEPRLFIACDDNQDPQDSLESAEKSDKAPATLNLGMDLNLDWMTLDEFQKHLNGEDEILSAPPLSPSELRDAVKSGDYMSVKLALNSKEDYNLDQEACTVEKKSLIDEERDLIEKEKSTKDTKNSTDQEKDLNAGDKHSSKEVEKNSSGSLRSREEVKSSSDQLNSSSDEEVNSGEEEQDSTGRLSSSSIVRSEGRIDNPSKKSKSSDKVRNSSEEENNCNEEDISSSARLRSSERLRSRPKKNCCEKSNSSSDEEENSSSSDSEWLDSTVASESDNISSDEGLSSDNGLNNTAKILSLLRNGKKCEDSKTASSEVTIIPLSKKVNGKRKWDKKHYCLYCKAPHTKIGRHLQTKHAGEMAVAHATRFPKGSSIRKDLFSQLRNTGDYHHNYEVLRRGNGELVTKKRTSRPTSVRDFLPCQFCCAFFRKSELWRHERVCKFRKVDAEPKRRTKTRVQSMSSRLLPLAYATGGCEEIIHKMNQDEIAVHIRNDPLICKYGNALSARHDHDKSQYAYIAQKMRELARFMLAVNEVDNSVKYLHEICLPSKFELAVEGAKKVSGFDEMSNKFKTTTLVSKIGYSLKRAAEIAFGESRMTEDSETECQVREFIKLLDMEWSNLFSRSVLSSLRRAERKELDASSLTTDLIKLHKFLKNSADESKKELLETPSPLAWKKLCETLLTEVFLFNKSRGGDAGKLLLETYASRKCKRTPVTADVLNRLTKMEVFLGDTLTRMELEGNGGRKMPLLLSEEMVLSIDILTENREKAGVPEDNPYVFGRREALSNTRGHDCLRRALQQCDVTNADIFSSGKLRKLIASHCQLLNLNDRELDRVSQLFGREHLDCYRLAENPSLLAELSQLAVTLDQNSELDSNKDHTCVAFPVCAQTHKKRTWSDEEQAAVKRQLAASIAEMTVPGKRECDACIDAEPVLQSRTWKDIKNYVHNTLQTIRKKHFQVSSDMDIVNPELPRSRQKAEIRKRKREEEGDGDVPDTMVHSKVHTEKMRPVTAAKPRKKGSWSDEEQAALRRQFNDFVFMIKAPGKSECDACIAAEPALKDRVWKEIKNYVHNRLQTRKKQGSVRSPMEDVGGPDLARQTPEEELEAPPTAPVYTFL
ncbi:M-phase phosphoprotein 8 isoform X2 [Osmerus eperlanus]|uniref:M-phase phosphoprotein 8 isoform X2 n=1 Tax=Osmerus eperlanus TaxID=29151 RepID=UPI002E0FC48B